MSSSTLSNTLRHAFAAAAVFALAFAPLATSAQDGDVQMTESGPGGVSTQQIIHVSATVTAVDQKNRIITLKGPEGNVADFAVSDDVQRLKDVKVGDMLDVGYLESVGLDFREATPEEMKNPLTVTDASDRADKKQAPAGAKMQTTRAVVTLEGMSRLDNTLTVLTPRGNYFIVEVQDGMVKWESLHIGQTMVGTYTEALVMSIDPAAKKIKK